MRSINTGNKLQLILWVGIFLVSVIFVRLVAISYSHEIVTDLHSSEKEPNVFIPFYRGKQWLFHSPPIFIPLENLAFRNDGYPVVNASFKQALKQSTAKLPASLNQDQLKRLSLLTQRQYPGRKGQVLAAWLETYYQYREAKVLLLKSENSSNGSLATFRELIQLRELYFGEVQAKLLYEHQYRFVENLAKLEEQ